MEDRKQWLTENSYSRQEKLVFGLCDARQEVRLGTLLGLAAAVAGQDYEARGLSRERLYALRQVFLLSRIALRIHRRPKSGEMLTVTTWENGAKGAHVQRNYEMTDDAGGLCVSGKSEWIIVDPENRRILRPGTFTARTITVCPKEIDCPECRKIILPKEGLTELGERRVCYSDLDGNGHLHSGQYGNLIWDYLPEDLQYAPLQTFFLNYSKEAPAGEKLRLRGFRDGGDYLMEGAAEGGLCFTCQCEFAL